MAISLGSTLPGPNRTGPSLGLGQVFVYPDPVFD
jgi:hypothetical protein